MVKKRSHKKKSTDKLNVSHAWGALKPKTKPVNTAKHVLDEMYECSLECNRISESLYKLQKRLIALLP